MPPRIDRRERPYFFAAAFLFAAHRAFISSESFLRPAAVNLLRWLTALSSWLMAEVLMAAYLRFMASEIFFLAAALILLLLGGVELPAGAVCAVAGRGFSWDWICAISSSIFARSASSPVKARSSSLCLSGMYVSL